MWEKRHTDESSGRLSEQSLPRKPGLPRGKPRQAGVSRGSFQKCFYSLGSSSWSRDC